MEKEMMVNMAEFMKLIEEFLPLIFLGSYIYIGKETSFGLKKYEIS